MDFPVENEVVLGSGQEALHDCIDDSLAMLGPHTPNIRRNEVKGKEVEFWVKHV